MQLTGHGDGVQRVLPGQEPAHPQKLPAIGVLLRQECRLAVVLHLGKVAEAVSPVCIASGLSCIGGCVGAGAEEVERCMPEPAMVQPGPGLGEKTTRIKENVRCRQF